MTVDQDTASTATKANPFWPSPGTVTPAGRVGGRDLTGEPHPLPRPGLGTSLADVGWAEPAQADEAVAAAVAAGSSWGACSPYDRGRALRAIAGDLRSNAPALAEILCAESGKRIAEATAEVEFSAQYFDWFADSASRLRDGYLESGARRFLVRHRPVGVVAAVSPWNFPLSIPARKIAPALAAGCPVIQKASELTPLSSIALTRIAEAHLPEGVIGLLVGDGVRLTGKLVDHPDVAAITFTGSTRVGCLVAARAMQSMTRVTMELGGMSPFIICAGSDVDRAVDTLMIAKFRNNGASCIAANNVYVHASLHADVRAALIERIGSMRVGDPMDRATDLGPMLRPDHVDRLRGLLAEADRAGCAITSGPDGPDERWFVAPTLVEAAAEITLWNQEIFGPICAVQAFTDEDAVVDEVRGRRLGLGGYVVSGDTDHAIALASRLPIGIIGIGTGAPNTPEVPFGGFGLSGLGREGGESGLAAFVEEQTLAIAS